MKICIYGAGAVGGFIGAQVARAGFEVNVVDLGVTLEALRSHGLRLESEGASIVEQVRATDDPAELGVQDVVIVAVKAIALTHVARRIAPLIGPGTMVVTAMNGVPWWFFQGVGGKYADTPLRSVDPDGSIAAAIPFRNIVGCVVHGSFSLKEPGFVRHGFGKRLIIGEPDGTVSERVRGLADVLSKATFDIEISRKIQSDIWFKLWGNMTMNPISAITGATCDRLLEDPLVTRFCLDAMAEAARIGAKVGCPVSQSGEERNEVTRKLGAFKTSMLQDVEAGRAVEIDALIAVVCEIAEKVDEPTPYLNALLGIARLHARAHGLYPW